MSVGEDLRGDESVRAKADALIRALGLPIGWQLPDLAAAVTTLTGRPLELFATSSIASRRTCGWALGTADGGVVIAHPPLDHPRGRRVIGHEVGHVLFEHGTTAAALADSLANPVATALAPARGESIYEPDAEYEAEVFSIVLWSRTTRPSGSSLRLF